jgi:hypothetical protein
VEGLREAAADAGAAAGDEHGLIGDFHGNLIWGWSETGRTKRQGSLAFPSAKVDSENIVVKGNILHPGS